MADKAIAWMLGPAANQVGVFLQSLKEFPLWQKSFDIDLDERMKTMSDPINRQAIA